MNTTIKKEKKIRRQRKIKAKIFAKSKKPRISVFKSNKYLYLQLIDDVEGKTLCAADTRKVKGASLKEKARLAGKELAQKAQGVKVSDVVFDRSGYIYTGIVKEAAEGAREGGLKF